MNLIVTPARLFLRGQSRDLVKYLAYGLILSGAFLGGFWNAGFADGPTVAEPTPGEKRMAEIIADRLVVNAHEHIQGPDNVPDLLAAMDMHGIRKTILVGSSWFTLRLYERAGFTRYDENNEAILQIAKDHPERFEAWPTINPLDPRNLEKITDLIDRGATGVKLYTGHGYVTFYSNQYMFHPIALDDPRMFRLYEYWEANHIPLCFHVNPDRPGFADEFVSVLNRYPDLKINAPHWILSSMKESRLHELFTTYPNLYTDISFGHDEFMVSGLQRISMNPERFRRLLETFPDRFMFGTDFVYTDFDRRSPSWAATRIKAYYDMLSKETYTTPLIPNISLRGLNLSPELLDNILFKNYEAFKAKKPENTILERSVNWNRMRVWRHDRKPGEALPPPPRNRRGS